MRARGWSIDREGEIVCRTVRIRTGREEGKRAERLGVRASAREEEPLYGGIGKFRCETKKGKDGGGGGGKRVVEGYRRRARGNGTKCIRHAAQASLGRPSVFPSRVFAVRSSYSYRLWQFPRTLWERKRGGTPPYAHRFIRIKTNV